MLATVLALFHEYLGDFPYNVLDKDGLFERFDERRDLLDDDGLQTVIKLEHAIEVKIHTIKGMLSKYYDHRGKTAGVLRTIFMKHTTVTFLEWLKRNERIYGWEYPLLRMAALEKHCPPENDYDD